MGLAKDFHKLWVRFEETRTALDAALERATIAEQRSPKYQTAIDDLHRKLAIEKQETLWVRNSFEEVKAGYVETIDKLKKHVEEQRVEIVRLNELYEQKKSLVEQRDIQLGQVKQDLNQALNDLADVKQDCSMAYHEKNALRQYIETLHPDVSVGKIIDSYLFGLTSKAPSEPEPDVTFDPQPE